MAGTASTKYSIPVGLGISNLNPSPLTLTCLPSPSLVSTTLRGVGVGSISAARKRISLCEARCFRSRNINIKIIANAATTPPTIGPSWSRGDRNLEGSEEAWGKVVLSPCKLLYIRILFQGKEHSSPLVTAVVLGTEEKITLAWGKLVLTAWQVIL